MSKCENCNNWITHDKNVECEECKDDGIRYCRYYAKSYKCDLCNDLLLCEKCYKNHLCIYHLENPEISYEDKSKVLKTLKKINPQCFSVLTPIFRICSVKECWREAKWFCVHCNKKTPSYSCKNHPFNDVPHCSLSHLSDVLNKD